MGIFDHPAVIDYILQQTNNSKLYYLGYSQGTTSLMVLLSERPEYNSKIHVASLMAPVAYMSLPFISRLLLPSAQKLLTTSENTEILSRALGRPLGVMCALNLGLCNEVVNFIFGSSQNQRNTVS